MNSILRGSFPDEYGVRTTRSNVDGLPDVVTEEYNDIVRGINILEVPKDTVKTYLKRNWQTVMTFLKDTPKDDLVQAFRSKKLKHLQVLGYYETYAGTICNMPPNSIFFFKSNCEMFLATLPKLTKAFPLPRIPPLVDLEVRPCLSTILLVGALLGDTTPVIFQLTGE